MAITTQNTNIKNDSKWARHRSITKNNRNQLKDVTEALKSQQGVHYRRFDCAPKQLREEWVKEFGQPLPTFRVRPGSFKGTSGVGEWLGSSSPFLTDLNAIWQDFTTIFARRADGEVNQRLFISYTSTNFDLIYSKWGADPEEKDHKFFHWASVADTVPEQEKKRATIDEFADADDQGDDENDM